MAVNEMFDGFDHTRYREEVEQRWGAEAYADSDRWWRGLDDAGRQGFVDDAAQLSEDWQQARATGEPVDGPRAQAIAARHVDWIRRGWAGKQPSPEAIRGLAQMYVDDERFSANYGGLDGAMYVRDALVVFARSR